MKNLLEISHLNLYIQRKQEKKKLLNQIHFQLAEEEIIGLVGASGSGKTLLAHLIADLLPSQMFIEGNLLFQGAKKRNQEISMVFQNPATSLNPTLKIKTQILEALNKKERRSKKERFFLIEKILSSLSLDPKIVLNSYPHELSGGMQQRVVIAIAIVKKPKLIIADEPTTALDQPLQTETLLLLKEVLKKNKIACIFITHDLSLLSNFCHKVSVMQKGELVEQNTLAELYTSPQHEYTKALVQATPHYEVLCNQF